MLPESAVRQESVVFCATSGSSQKISAGWQRLCFFVSHRKSSTRRFFFPSHRRVPRPTICAYRLRLLVGRKQMIQSTVGQSQPSVRSIAFGSALYSPLSNPFRTSFRSADAPLTSAVLKFRLLRILHSLLLIRTRGVKMTVFRFWHSRTMASAIVSRYRSRTLPRS